MVENAVQGSEVIVGRLVGDGTKTTGSGKKRNQNLHNMSSIGAVSSLTD